MYLPERRQELIEIGAMTELVEDAVNFAVDDRVFLWLGGDVGQGKTWAAEVAQKLHRFKGKTITAFELSRCAPWDQLIDACLECPGILLVDDIGTEIEAKAGKFQALVDGIVSTRHKSKRKTIITTNVGLIAFKDKFGDRVMDRIVELGTVQWCDSESNGGSLRGKTMESYYSWRYPLRPDTGDLEKWEVIQNAPDPEEVDAMIADFMKRATALGEEKKLDVQ